MIMITVMCVLRTLNLWHCADYASVSASVRPQTTADNYYTRAYGYNYYNNDNNNDDYEDI